MVSSFKGNSKLGRFAGAAEEFRNATGPFPNVRLGKGFTNRDKQLISWRLPNGTTVQMYLNPQNLSIKESKQISQVRTKGGYIVQYWGDNLTEINISGTTGSSGVKGINVLRDIYRSENKAFDLVAATQFDTFNSLLSGGSSVSSIPGDTGFTGAIDKAAEKIRERNFILRPSLASLALSITMFYQGVQYKGFFNNFTVTETVESLGLFDYTMTFMVTETRGKRQNFMAWHKEPLSDDIGGQLLNGVGNAIRSKIGLADQAPTQYHPENAPYTFGYTEAGSISLKDPKFNLPDISFPDVSFGGPGRVSGGQSETKSDLYINTVKEAIREDTTRLVERDLPLMIAAGTIPTGARYTVDEFESGLTTAAKEYIEGSKDKDGLLSNLQVNKSGIATNASIYIEALVVNRFTIDLASPTGKTPILINT